MTTQALPQPTHFHILLNRSEDMFRRQGGVTSAGYQHGDQLDVAHEGVVVTDESEAALLEEIFRIYNIDHPADYADRSLSVGDVVEINGRRYACQPTGWTRLVEPVDPLYTNTLDRLLEEDEEADRAKAFDAWLDDQERHDALDYALEATYEERYGYHGAGVEYDDDFEDRYPR